MATAKNESNMTVSKAKQSDKRDPKSFVKVQDLTEKMFKDLPKKKVILKHQVTKNGYDRCSINFTIHKQMLPIEMQISLPRFNNIVLSCLNKDVIFDRHGHMKREYIVNVRIRFVKGQSDYGEYKSIELIFKPNIHQIYFFGYKNLDEKEVLDQLEEKSFMNVDWYDRGEKVDQAETINYEWDN